MQLSIHVFHWLLLFDCTSAYIRGRYCFSDWRHRPTQPRMWSNVEIRAMDTEHLKLDLNILVIDHYDSFTYNLADLLTQVCVSAPTVMAADRMDSLEDISQFDGVILSPGPGHPKDAICQFSKQSLLRNCDLPFLGVCLGHQIMGELYGGVVDFAPEPVHGQITTLRLLDASMSDPLWIGVPTETKVNVTRYHSLQVHPNGSKLVPTAVTDNGDQVVMAMHHTEFPHFGVQFHPESIGTNETGKLLIRNFAQICWNCKATRKPAIDVVQKAIVGHFSLSTTGTMSVCPEDPLHRVYVHKCENLPPNGANMQPADIMSEFLTKEDYCFWLDDALPSGPHPAVSILGASEERVEYFGKEKPDGQCIFVWNKNNVRDTHPDTDILSYLKQRHARVTDQATMISFDGDEVLFHVQTEDSLSYTLPFDYRGGHVGYLGYEVRHDTENCIQKKDDAGLYDKSKARGQKELKYSDPKVPTAAFLWADRSFVYDHAKSEWYLVGVVDESKLDQKTSTLAWMRSMAERLRQGSYRKPQTPPFVNRKHGCPSFSPNRSRETYNRNFADCLEYIRQGESYELCLTNQLEASVVKAGKSLVDLYSILRRRNAAPLSAYFNWNSSDRQDKTLGDASFALCCSSPERFVSVKRKHADVDESNEADLPLMLHVEAKPIKGTIARVTPESGRQELNKEERLQDIARARRLKESVKDRAENLMIVDLLRNDLSRVCETGSVHVSKLMGIESYATVHQMVSTICGTLDSSQRSAVDVLRACFPGGSMTGAPKLRTTQLLDTLEEGVSRGPYSGCLGYISMNGSMDMNILIRTAVVTPSDDSKNEWKVRIGAGGAITALSDSAGEYDEMMLKASAVISAVEEWVSSTVAVPHNTIGERNSTEVNSNSYDSILP